MTARSIRQGSIDLSLDRENLYGRLTIPGMNRHVTARRIRKAANHDVRFMHRAKNGVYDPMSYYHVVDVLTRARSGQEFRTTELLETMRAQKPQLVWDTTTLGRILADVAETMHESYGWTPIGYVRRWNGMTYDVLDGLESRVALYRLLEDLVALCEDELKAELRGEAPKRIDSPLLRCPSVAGVAG